MAAVAEGLLKIYDWETVVFFGFGMREEQLLKVMPTTIREQDSFLANCVHVAERVWRFAAAGDEITLVLPDKVKDGRDILPSEVIERRLGQIEGRLDKTSRFG